jgi:hypothetical protein
VHEARDTSRLQLPQRLFDLKDEQQSGALVALQQVDGALRQAVLDEWDTRCRGSPYAILPATCSASSRKRFVASSRPARGKTVNRGRRAPRRGQPIRHPHRPDAKSHTSTSPD